MIAFGCAITDSIVYHRCAEPGIRLAAEPDSKVFAHASVGLNNPENTFRDFNLTGSIFQNYNMIIDQARKLDDLEALVLLHQDSEIVDADFCDRLRRSLADPDVAIVGCAGAIGVRSIAWWEGSVTWASFAHRYSEQGGGVINGPTWERDELPVYGRTGEVDTIDGYVIAMTPWALENLRFDESLGQFHGYDFDICLQARAAGKKVVTQDMRVIHHHSLDLIGDLDGWIEAHVKVAEKWNGRMPGVGYAAGDWEQRARRAEAEADAARMLANATELLRDATVEKLWRERDLVVNSSSWKLTAPLRWLGRRLRGRRG
jgi:Glycosyltransferase like family